MNPPAVSLACACCIPTASTETADTSFASDTEISHRGYERVISHPDTYFMWAPGEREKVDASAEVEGIQTVVKEHGNHV